MDTYLVSGSFHKEDRRTDRHTVCVPRSFHKEDRLGTLRAQTPGL